jgi:hypothetical protein
LDIKYFYETMQFMDMTEIDTSIDIISRIICLKRNRIDFMDIMNFKDILDFMDMMGRI